MSARDTRPELETRTVDKPWGHELIWALTDRYCGKILFVRGGECLSLQYHRERDESWYVLEGRALLEFGSVDGPRETIEIGVGSAFRFAPRTVHRVSAIEDTRILEVSTPELDDLVRLEDRYGRVE